LIYEVDTFTVIYSRYRQFESNLRAAEEEEEDVEAFATNFIKGSNQKTIV
jgi:hypothetical protein